MARARVAAAVVLAVAGTLAVAPTGAPGGGAVSVERGRELYDAHCARCHGPAAAGQSREQPEGGRDEAGRRLAPALDGSGHAWHHPPALIHRYIREGSIDATSPMPAFGDRLSEDEAWAIVGYLRSLWPEEILREYRRRFADEVP